MAESGLTSRPAIRAQFQYHAYFLWQASRYFRIGLRPHAFLSYVGGRIEQIFFFSHAVPINIIGDILPRLKHVKTWMFGPHFRQF